MQALPTRDDSGYPPAGDAGRELACDIRGSQAPASVDSMPYFSSSR
jgi:hypothetical protein